MKKREKKTLEKKTRPPIELGLGRSHRGELFDELLSNVVIKKKKVTWGGIDPPTDRLCVFTTPQRSMFPLYHQVLQTTPKNSNLKYIN